MCDPGRGADRPERPPADRRRRVARHAAARVGRRVAGRRGADRRGLRAEPALRRAHLGRRAVLDHRVRRRDEVPLRRRLEEGPRGGPVPAARRIVGRAHRVHRDGARPDRAGRWTASCRPWPQAVSVDGPRDRGLQSAAVEARRRGRRVRSRPTASRRRADAGRRRATIAAGRRPTGRRCASSPATCRPMGYRTYRARATGRAGSIRRRRSTHATATIENRVLQGRARSGTRRDPLAGRQAVRPRAGRRRAPHGFGQYLYERFDADQVQAFVEGLRARSTPTGRINEFGKPNLPPADEVAVSGRLARRTSQLRVRADAASRRRPCMEAAAGDGLPHAVTTRVTLYRDQPVRGPGDHAPRQAGRSLARGRLDLPAVQGRRSRSSAWAGWARSSIRPRTSCPGRNRHLFGAQQRADRDSTPQGRGVGLCPIDHPLVSLDAPGCWKYSKDFVPQQARGLRQPVQQPVDHELPPLERGHVDLARPPLGRSTATTPESCAGHAVAGKPDSRFRRPWPTARPGKLPPARAGVELSRRGVLVTAFGPNPDGDGHGAAAVGAGRQVRAVRGAIARGRCRQERPAGRPAGRSDRRAYRRDRRPLYRSAARLRTGEFRNRSLRRVGQGGGRLARLRKPAQAAAAVPPTFRFARPTLRLLRRPGKAVLQKN